MNKMLITLGAIGLAAAVQAASFEWKTTTYTYAATTHGTAVTTEQGYSDMLNGGKIVLAILEDGDFSKAKSLAAVQGVSGATAGIITQGTGATKGNLKATFSFTYNSTDTSLNPIHDGDILAVMFEDGSGNLSKLKILAKEGDPTDLQATYTVTGLDTATDPNLWTGSTFTFASGTSGSKTYLGVNVPEPTSGLLLVLGMAGLALRRRRA